MGHRRCARVLIQHVHLGRLQRMRVSSRLEELPCAFSVLDDENGEGKKPLASFWRQYAAGIAAEPRGYKIKRTGLLHFASPFRAR